MTKVSLLVLPFTHGAMPLVLLADDALRGRLAAEAAGRARGYRWDHVVKQWLGLYEQVAVLDR